MSEYSHWKTEQSSPVGPKKARAKGMMRLSGGCGLCPLQSEAGAGSARRNAFLLWVHPAALMERETELENHTSARFTREKGRHVGNEDEVETLIHFFSLRWFKRRERPFLLHSLYRHRWGGTDVLSGDRTTAEGALQIARQCSHCYRTLRCRDEEGKGTGVSPLRKSCRRSELLFFIRGGEGEERWVPPEAVSGALLRTALRGALRVTPPHCATRRSSAPTQMGGGRPVGAERGERLARQPNLSRAGRRCWDSYVTTHPVGIPASLLLPCFCYSPRSW